MRCHRWAPGGPTSCGLRLYLVDAADFDAVGAVHGRLLGDVQPACTGVVVAALLNPAWKVEIEVDAVVG